MQYKIIGNIYITRDHPACSYGQPVVLIEGEPHGPMDVYLGRLVSDIVYFWEMNPTADIDGEKLEPCEGEARDLAMKFLHLSNALMS